MRIIRGEETIPNSLTETTRVKHELTLALKLKGNWDSAGFYLSDYTVCKYVNRAWTTPTRLWGC